MLRALVFGVSAFAANTLSNADLIQMKQAGLSDAIITQAVQESGGGSQFDTSATALIHLKKAGFGDAVIAALINRKAPTAVAQADKPMLPEDVGVYVVRKGELISVEPELVTERTAGVLKYALTAGIMKAKIKGAVEGPRSRLQLSGSVDLVIRVAEGVGITEYQFVRMDLRSSRREFEMARLGISGASTGTTPHQVPFKHEKVASRTYRVTCAGLPSGEYGFISPGALGSVSSGTTGKIYTFGLE